MQVALAQMLATKGETMAAVCWVGVERRCGGVAGGADSSSQ
jgi:hypothetical protein